MGIKFLLDENVPKELQRLLHAKGLEADFIRGNNDFQICMDAAQQGAVLITADLKDFLPLYAIQANHPGLVVLPTLAGKFKVEHLYAKFSEFAEWVAGKSAEPDFSLRNRLVVLKRHQDISIIDYTMPQLQQKGVVRQPDSSKTRTSRKGNYGDWKRENISEREKLRQVRHFLTHIKEMQCAKR